MATAYRLPRPAREELAGVGVEAEVRQAVYCENRKASDVRPGGYGNEANIVVAGSREVTVQNGGTVDDAVGGVEPLLAEGAV